MHKIIIVYIILRFAVILSLILKSADSRWRERVLSSYFPSYLVLLQPKREFLYLFGTTASKYKDLGTGVCGYITVLMCCSGFI